MKPTRTVKTADTLLSVIDQLQALDGAGVTELATHLGMAKSTVHDHLATLHEHGYVVKRGNTYHLGLRFLDHGTHARDQFSPRSAVVPAIRRLAEDTGESVWFVVEEHGRAVYLHRSIGVRGIDVVRRPGRQIGIHATAAGKAILANYSDDRIREIVAERGLERLTLKTVTDVESLLGDVEKVRNEGVAVTAGEAHPSLGAVAASVSVSGRTLGAVSVSGPEQRLVRNRRDEIVDELLATVDEIEILACDDEVV